MDKQIVYRVEDGMDRSKVLCTTILQIVSIVTRDNGVAKFERFDGLSETIGFVVVGRLWGTVRQVTKSATACAEFPENQKGSCALRKAFGPIGAGGFSADGGKRIQRQNVANGIFSAASYGSPNFEPSGFGQRLNAVGSCLTRNLQYLFKTAS